MTDPQFQQGERVYVRNSNDEPWLSATLIYVAVQGCQLLYTNQKGSWLALPTYLARVDGMPRNAEFRQIKKQ